jgi:predicted DNA-binding transcriptional regulator YafY
MTSPDTLTRAEQACSQLAEDGQPVTFTAVAALTQISRATLYRDLALRALVDEHRHRSAEANTLTGLAADISALRAALEAVAGRVRHHEEQLRQLTRQQRRPAGGQ